MPKPQITAEQGATRSGMALHSQIFVAFADDRKEKVRMGEGRREGTEKEEGEMGVCKQK